MVRQKVVGFSLKTKIDITLLRGRSKTEKNIINETLNILNSNEMQVLMNSHQLRQTKEVNINGRTIIYEIDRKCESNYFGMSLFDGDSFALFCDAFQSKKELIKTLLHELHRIHTSNLRGIDTSGAKVKEETDDAFNFSNKIYNEIFQ